MTEVLTTGQAGRRLGVTKKAIGDWIKKGLFPGAYRVNPSSRHSPFRIPVEDVEAFEEKRRATQFRPPPN